MKKLCLASCLLTMMILLSGCGAPANPAQTDSSSFVADDMTQTASVPYSSGLPELSCGISEKLMEKAGDTLAAHPSLPVYQLEPVLLNVNEAFQTLSGQKADDAMDVSSWSYPDNEGNAVLMRSGLEPFYDYWLDIQCFTNRGTDLFYQTHRSYSIDAVFYPPEDAESQMEGNLSFSDRDTVQSAFVSLFAPYGTVGDLSCYSLSAHDLQKLYDRRKSEGSLRSERYSVGGDRKDAEQIAEKAKWTEEDALYYITASQLLSGVPYYGSEIEAWIDNQGWIKLSVSSFAAAKETSGSKPLAELSSILRSINDLTADLYSDHTDVIELALYYYRMSDGTCQPLWSVTISYSFHTPVSGMKEQRTASYWLNAYTADEVILDGDLE